MEFENNEIKRKNPINRNNLFYSEESFQFEMELGKNYLEQDINQTVILYEVDLENTNVSDIYKEANKGDIRFKVPTEIHVVYEVLPPELKTYEKQKELGSYQKIGNLEFGVYQATLNELSSEIKRGDFIGVQVSPEKIIYFEVFDDGKVNYSNNFTIYGYKPFYRSVKCSWVDPNLFNGN